MRGNKNGFSLIEVMIAMIVLSVGLLALVGMFETGMKSLQVGNKRTVASQLAQNKMEALRLTTPVPVSDKEDNPEGMTRRWSIRKSKDDPNIWVISVEVSWTSSQDRLQRVSLKSLKFF
ncbi:MAG: type IV pilus modification protein PilV [Nitrospiria bacterium]